MKTTDFDYHLPPELIAQHPTERRDQSRMMVLDKASGEIEDLRFRDFPSLLKAGDVLVINDTKVIPARLLGQRSSGAKVELFLLHPLEGGNWRCLVQPGRKVRPGDTVIVGDLLQAKIIDRHEDGTRSVAFEYEGDFEAVIEKVGHVPLPPYIQREDFQEDRERYQTVYARRAGAVAAPTAGLHFTPEILTEIEKAGIRVARITLHVGMGTFKPVNVENVKDHTMEAEWYEISQDAANLINEGKTSSRVIAVGTTSVRTLESAWNDSAQGIVPGSGWTDIFITPGYRFKAVDSLLTNFHLPCSTLIMLVSALAGRDNILNAYRHAVESAYRFYSYGDCMFINKPNDLDE